MKHILLVLACLAFVASAAFAANPQDEQTVRNAYAKLAYAVQSRTVYVETRKAPNITTVELAKKLLASELRFDITEMSSGKLSDIEARPYSDFVTKPDLQEVVEVTHNEETLTENGTLYSSYFATPHWSAGETTLEDWDSPVKAAIAGSRGVYTRYVTATVTVRLKGKSRTYRTLWLFSDSDLMAIDTVAGNYIVRSFARESAYPSVLADTSMRSRPVVNDWLNSTQHFEATCKKGKLDVCCDAAMRCGVASDDLQSTKPAPNTTVAQKVN
jgi:hypothetical protein